MNDSSQAMARAGQIIFVTGGASGIGFQTARRLADRGCKVALVDRFNAQVQSAAASLGEGHFGVEADVTDLASLEAAAAKTVEHFGKIDVVIANAGIGSASTVRVSGADQLLRIIDVNLSGQIRTVKATLEHVIASQGHIVFTCSAAVLKHTPKSSAYAAAKAGVDAFAGSLRQEVAHRGVTVGVFYPGWTPTPLIQGAGSRASASKTLPWPFSITNSLDDVADAYAESVMRRRRSTYVPKIYRFVHWMRPLFTGSVWDRNQHAEVEKNVVLWEKDFLAEAAEEGLNGSTGTE